MGKAKAIHRDTPDLIDKVMTRQMSLDAAERERKKHVAALPKPEKSKPAATILTLYTHEGTPIEYGKPKGISKFNETAGPGISWAAWSWNPVTGCLHGCEYCYAREIATKAIQQASPLFHPERLQAPANTTIPAKHAGDPAYRRVIRLLNGRGRREADERWPAGLTRRRRFLRRRRAASGPPGRVLRHE